MPDVEEGLRSADPVRHRLAWEDRGRLREVLREDPVVHVLAPALSPDEFVEFAEGLGTPEPTLRAKYRHPDRPEIMVVGNVRNECGQKAGASALRQGFHSDMSWRARPPELTLLYARAVPPVGGDTHFTSLYRLHDELDPGTRKRWARLEVVHESNSTYFTAHPDRRSVHPLLVRHPESGRWVVFTSPPYMTQVVGLSSQDSDTLLGRLREAVTPPDTAHRWNVNDLLVWDNRAVVHSATPYDPEHVRCLWRLSVRL